MKRGVIWTLGILLSIGIIGALALQYAISQNGPAVLSAVDRLTGGSGNAKQLAVVSTGDHPQQKLVVWGPDTERQARSEKPRPVLLFLHGGSWRSGDPEDYDFVGRAFVERGFIVVLGGYRLKEAGKYPAMLTDTASVIGWTHREIAKHGGDPESIVIAGHSAGAYNVVMAALEEKWLAAEGLSPSDIAGVVGLSGPYDFFPFDSDSTIAAFGEAAEPESTQPIAHINGDAPQMLFLHGEMDTTVKPRNSRILAEKLKEEGGHALTVFFPDKDHIDPLTSLAAPWRSRREVADLIAGFATGVTSSDTVSVPVQEETR
ncbi:alpha/beta hydrolase [Erythrobacter crassostreae]|uniref:Alpha/beta hydrolase n=1 Tax=Erythrobacter crassostreae TaxID=2828328 RepID=A0A9X1F275_9SPHN|nr:alpha/beta hydrolase [Erythrobacter crassostrea]MBV7258651.1 alpha/beta hydrolase [Erythrobacter crassostrea]